MCLLRPRRNDPPPRRERPGRLSPASRIPVPVGGGETRLEPDRWGRPAGTVVDRCGHASPPDVVACYHDGMDRKITTVRLPEDLAETAEVVARGKGVSVNALIVDALAAEIDRVKA